jgi:hypothetical protein
LGFFGARKISREERRERQRDDACRAFAAYLAAVYAWVAELREMPPDPRSDVLVRLLDRAQGDAAAWMRQKREQAKLGTATSRFGRASATQLPAWMYLGFPVRCAAPLTPPTIISSPLPRSAARS